MGLPWVRLDSNIASHDKILHLLSDPSPKRWQAAASYMFAMAWSGGQGCTARHRPRVCSSPTTSGPRQPPATRSATSHNGKSC